MENTSLHSTGHGIGLEIRMKHANVSRIATQAFVPGNVITNEPGIYLPGVGGVRIEDDIIINETGGEVIQQVPRELNYSLKWTVVVRIPVSW